MNTPRRPDVNEMHQNGTLPEDPFDGLTFVDDQGEHDHRHTDTDDDSWRESVVPPDANGSPPANRLRVNSNIETRPDIQIVTDVHLVTEAMIHALRSDPELYVRGGKLTHVIRVSETDPGIVAGSPVARECPMSWVGDRISRVARCTRSTPKGIKPVPPPPDRVRAVLDHGEWPGVRELRGIIESPALRPDGTIIQEPGHDAATKYLFEPNAEFTAIDENPTHADAVRAFERLAEPFCDFPYVNPAHLSAVIAAILTLFARPAIQGSVPCLLFDASAARSGKSLQVDVIHIIATGRPASRMTYPEQDDELEKVLSGYAVRGSSTVNFDNVARPFGGAALDKCITAVDKVDLRVLGATDLVTFDWRAVIFASGNNVTCRGDMLARVLSPRLETNHDNPEARTDLKHADLRAYVASCRVELAHAALTILRAYVAAGRPDMGCPRWGGFEAWARLIPHALVWVGAADPMGARRGMEGDEDPEKIAAAGLVDGWRKLTADVPNGLTVKRAIELLYPQRSHNDPREPDGYDDLREAIESVTPVKPGFHPSPKHLGDALRRIKGKPVNGYRLRAEPGGKGVLRWIVTTAT